MSRAIRWGVAGLVLLVGAVVVVSLVRGADTPPPPRLAADGAATPSGPLAGTLRPTAGSFVGYRVRETVAGVGLNVAVGRTGEVSGSARFAGGRIVDARFEADTRTLRSDEARRDAALRTRGLETDRYQVSGFVLGPPVRLPPPLPPPRTPPPPRPP